MGCGSSSHVLGPDSAHGKTGNGTNATNGNGTNATNGNGTNATNGRNGFNDHNDDLPTVVLPETPIKTKPPVAYEIPIEEFEGARRSSTPPPYLQRLLQQPSAEISLPVIDQKLAEAEQRRLLILQQRAASAQKRTQGMMKAFAENGKNHRNIEETMHGSNILSISPHPGV